MDQGIKLRKNIYIDKVKTVNVESMFRDFNKTFPIFKTIVDLSGMDLPIPAPSPARKRELHSTRGMKSCMLSCPRCNAEWNGVTCFSCGYVLSTCVPVAGRFGADNFTASLMSRA